MFVRGVPLETELAALEEAPAQHQQDPTLLDELPYLGDVLTHAPAALTERLLDAFDVQAVYNRDKNQVTIHATLTTPSPRPSATCSPTPEPTTTPAIITTRNQGPRSR